MNLDTKSNVTKALYASNEMNKIANTTQVKTYRDANTSFANEMRLTTEQKEKEDNTVEEKLSEEKVDKASSQKDTQKTEQKKSEKATKEQASTQDATASDTTSEAQSQNNFQGQGFSQNGNNEQQNAYASLTNEIQACMNAKSADFNFAALNPMSATSQSQLSGMVTTVNYSSIQMSDADAKFFADLVAKTDMNANSIAAEFEKQMQQGNVKMVQSTAKASAALIEALKESAKNHQSFRVDFDKDISVILQVDKGGKINANFIPGDKAVEAYLRNNIESLRQRFNEENIAYNDLTYSQSRRNRQEREQNNNKENS